MQWMQPVLPPSIVIGVPNIASHNHIEESEEPDASCEPSGENATELTLPVCPSKIVMNTPDAASHKRTEWSQEPDANLDPSGEKHHTLNTLHMAF